MVKDQVSIFIFQTLNELWEDHYHSALTAANFLCINLDINTPPERLLSDKNDPCDSIHTSNSHLPEATYFRTDYETTKKATSSEPLKETISDF